MSLKVSNQMITEETEGSESGSQVIVKIEEQISEQKLLREKAKIRIQRELAQQTENLYKRLADRRKRKSLALQKILNTSHTSINNNNLSHETFVRDVFTSPNTALTKHKMR